MYAVILAGGGGTRLWPLSSPERPKPFLPLLGDRTLLQLTADRLEGVVAADSVFVVTDQRYVSIVRDQLPGAHILPEPVGRNTTAAIALATVAIDRLEDEVMLVLPADQTIENVLGFQGVLRDAESELALGSMVSGPLVTLGVEIKHAATEYGYLIPNRATEQVGKLTGYVLEAFQEKPSAARADELWRRGAGIAWNAGMFMWQRRAIRANLEAFAAGVMELVAMGFASGALAETYPQIAPISIDYAVMEPAAAEGRVVMGSMDVGWNDLGSWTALLGELGMPGIAARIAPAGEPFAAGADDLAIWRSAAGQLASANSVDATMVATTGPVAILTGAHQFKTRIDVLLERCSTPEASQ